VNETEQDKQFRRELEAAGEQAVRDDLNFRRGISTRGETKLQFVMRWLRENEREREARARASIRSVFAPDVLGCSGDACCCDCRRDCDRSSPLKAQQPLPACSLSRRAGKPARCRQLASRSWASWRGWQGVAGRALLAGRAAGDVIVLQDK
jgi:hypothetical protein